MFKRNQGCDPYNRVPVPAQPQSDVIEFVPVQDNLEHEIRFALWAQRQVKQHEVE